MPSINRSDLQKLSEAKLNDAILLCDNERYSNAYYLAGYALELGLKAAITRQISKHVLPDRNFIQKVYTHKLNDLVALAGLSAKLEKGRKSDPAFNASWSIVTDWNEQSRYEFTDSIKARTMLEALIDSESGIYTWLKKHW